MLKKLLPRLIPLYLLASCAPTQTQPPAPAATIKVVCSYPQVSRLPETKETQTKGGVNISLAPNTFQCVRDSKKSMQEIQPTFGESMTQAATGKDPNGLRYVETSITPVFRVTPDKIAIRVKITNQMTHVFRGAGTIVQYNFGGKNASVSAQDYSDLAGLTIPPRSTAEVMIYGPSPKDLPEKTTLSIFLYDVITKTNDAGKAVEKQNFEWFYDFQMQRKEEMGDVLKTKEWVLR